VGKMRNTCKTLVDKPEGTDYLGDLIVDERIILKCILETGC
jgi:hypothetical protein